MTKPDPVMSEPAREKLESRLNDLGRTISFSPSGFPCIARVGSDKPQWEYTLVEVGHVWEVWRNF